jgi:hypothetical protein
LSSRLTVKGSNLESEIEVASGERTVSGEDLSREGEEVQLNRIAAVRRKPK